MTNYDDREPCYVSGRVTGNENYREDFNNASLEIIAMDYKAINPVANVPLDKTWIWYMKRDIRLLLDCNTIYMIHGWWRSRGARLEWLIAKILNYKIIYQ